MDVADDGLRRKSVRPGQCRRVGFDGGQRELRELPETFEELRNTDSPGIDEVRGVVRMAGHEGSRKAALRLTNFQNNVSLIKTLFDAFVSSHIDENRFVVIR